MRRLFWIVFLLTHVGVVLAQDEWILASPQTHVLAGADFTVTLVRGAGAAAEPMPDSVVCKLSGDGSSVELRLTAVPQEEGGGPANAGTRRAYQATLPSSTVGLVTLELADRPSTKLLLLAEKALLEKAPAADPLARMSGHAVSVPKEATPVSAPALTSYEPMYFLVGTRKGASARFQLSFKYRLFDNASFVVGALPFLSGLHFAYTQTSLWDLADRSKPFRDTSYRPTAFYQWQGGAPVGARAGWTVQAGVQHESNGRDGDNSRSINTVFIHPDWRFHLGDASYLGIAPKVYAYLDKKDNPDITRYRGNVDLGLLLGQDDGWLLSSIVRRGKSGYGSVQLDASYPLRKPFFADTGGFVHLQYFSGYGETILDYNVRRAPQFRVGFSIVR